MQLERTGDDEPSPGPGRLRIVVYASKVSVASGKNRFHAPQELVDEVERGDRIPTEEEMEQIVASVPDPKERERVALAASGSFATTRAALAAVQDAAPVLRDAIECPERRKRAFEVLNTVVNTRHGTEQEEVVRRRVFADPTAPVPKLRRFDIAKTLFTVRCPRTNEPIDVTLGGVADGQRADGGAIVEIKKRMHRFQGVPVQERVQVHAYMVIYGVRAAALIEDYDGVERTHEVPFDDRFWGEVVEGLEATVLRVVPHLPVAATGEVVSGHGVLPSRNETTSFAAKGIGLGEASASAAAI